VKIRGIPSGERKLREAEFFYRLMKRHSRRSFDFPYYTSAYLSALKSCTEHNRLYSRDAKFKDWYRAISKSHFHHPDLILLFGLRNTEVHQTGMDGFELVGFEVPWGLTIKDVELKSEYRDGESVLMCRLPGETEFAEAKNQSHEWVWDVPGRPKVLELCYSGLNVVREVIASRAAMNFQD
jgi:hypothetical protein